MLEPQEWDVAVVGAGPAGLAAARAAAAAGARTIVLERAIHPRYKTCGGGLTGVSLATVADWLEVPARDQVRAVTVTLDGRREFTHRDDHPLLAMVVRDEFDDALRKAAVDAGAVVRQRTTVRAVADDGPQAFARLADGSSVRARVLVGADGSAGVSARHVGVEFGQVDLGLELEIAVPAEMAERWRGRVLLDWGPIPGSYGWVFPKGDRLTVGVIAARGEGERTRRYLRDFTARLGLAGYQPVHDSGHLTRCRNGHSPLRKGRVIVAGDAAGLLEPWTREGISFALRSGTLAGQAAARAALAEGARAGTGAAGAPGSAHNGAGAGAAGAGARFGDPDSGAERALEQYVAAIERTLAPEMDAGRRLLAGFARRPAAFHTALGSPKGWRTFAGFCRGERSFASLLDHREVRIALSVLARI